MRFPSKLEEPRVYSCNGSGTGDLLDVTVANGDTLSSKLDDASAVVVRAQPLCTGLSSLSGGLTKVGRSSCLASLSHEFAW